MHTSTASVAVYPRPSEVLNYTTNLVVQIDEYSIPIIDILFSQVDVIVKDEELEWEAKTSRGPGGQHVNKVQSAVRLTHRPTGERMNPQTKVLTRLMKNNECNEK